MPVCTICTNYFKSRLRVGDTIYNLYKRKHCLTCVPFRTRRYPASTHKRTCSSCNRLYVYKSVSVRGKRGTAHKCTTCISRDRRTATKQRAILLLGGECALCGYSKCSRALSFHHTDPTTKKFSISSRHNAAWRTIAQELQKCILLCANCHAETESNWTDSNRRSTDLQSVG